MPWWCGFGRGRTKEWSGSFYVRTLAWHDIGMIRIHRIQFAFISFSCHNLSLQEELHNACGKEGIKGKRLTKVGFNAYVFLL